MLLIYHLSSQVIAKRDKRDEAHDVSSRYDSKKDNAVDIQRFLADGLDKVTTKELSRQGEKESGVIVYL